MAGEFSQLEIAALTGVFINYDADGDDRLNTNEFVGVMDYLGLKGKLSKIEILDTFDEADEDKDGLIDFDAFIKICANYKEALPDLLID